MSDQLQQIVERMIAAGESEADIATVVQHYKPASAPAPSAPVPGYVDSALADNLALPLPMRAAQGLLRIAKRNPVTAGAIVGGTIAAPLTGGSSLIPAVIASGAGAAGGAGAAIAARQLATGRPESGADTVRTMAEEGALAAAGHGVGEAASGLLRLAGRGMYRFALAPTQQVLDKHPGVVRYGLETRTPVDARGLVRVTAAKKATLAAKQTALDAADHNVAYRTAQLANDVQQPIRIYAGDLRRAGLPDSASRFADRTAQFVAENPAGLKPSDAEAIKRTLDDRLGGAFRKIAKREPVTPNERYSMQLSQAIGDAQRATVPEYDNMNRAIMADTGLARAIKRRTVGSGGNQGLTNLLTVLGGVRALPARMAAEAGAMSRAGIAANELGKSAALPSIIRALMLALNRTNEQ